MTAATIRTLAAGAGAICAALVCLPVAAQGLVVCTHGGLERSVEVVYDNPGEPVPCEVRYAKSDGAVTSPWRAEREEGYCERQAVGLIQKLSDAGWSCQANGDDSPPVPVAEPEAAPSAEAAADSEVGLELDTAEADTVTPETDTVTPEPDAASDVAEPEATPE